MLIINAGEGVEKRLPTLLVEIEIGVVTIENSMEVP